MDQRAVIERPNIAKAKGIFTVEKTFRKAKEIRMFDQIKNELDQVISLEKFLLENSFYLKTEKRIRKERMCLLIGENFQKCVSDIWI